MTVDDLKAKLVLVEEFFKRPNFKEEYSIYITLRRWLCNFAGDKTQTEEHRTDAAMAARALKWAMNSVTGAHMLAKRYEFTAHTPQREDPPQKHYFTTSLLTSACRVR